MGNKLRTISGELCTVRNVNAQSARPMQGQWLRCHEYELRDGYVRAVGDSDDDFEAYDPWDGFYRLRLGTPRGEPGLKSALPAPYLDLLRLGDGLPSPDDEPSTLAEEQEAMVLDWYRAHGSLGLVSQKTSTAVLGPWPDQVPEEVQTEEGLEIFGVPALSQRIYIRTARGWTQHHDLVEGSREFLQDRSGTMSVEVRESMVVMTALDRPRPRGFSLAAGWGPYFPDVSEASAESHQYPLPNTPEFWLASGEPVSEFLFAVDVLRRVTRLGTTDNPRTYAAGKRALDALLTSAGVTLVRDDQQETHTQQWQAPSLIGIYALMMLQDLTADNAPLRVCPKCGQAFCSRKANYCSDDCANAFRVRLHRRRKRAKELAAEGLSRTEIAETMHATRSEVHDLLRSPEPVARRR